MATHRKQANIVLNGGESTGDVFIDCHNVLIFGRRYTSLPGQGNNYGLSLTDCTNVRVFECPIVGFARGIVASRVKDFDFSANRFAGMKIDGINLAQCWGGNVGDNDFTEPDTGDAHPDAIQLWSRPTMRLADGRTVPAPPTSDIVIARNRVKGMLTQGITAFNHIRNGVDDGGFDRITIVANKIEVGMPQGLALYNARASAVLHNDIRTLDGSRYKASMNLFNCPDLIHRGNIVAAALGKPGFKD